MTDSVSPGQGVDEPGAIAARPSRRAYPGTPRWVKLAAIASVVLVLVVVLVMALAGGEHGPMRHTPAGAGAGTTPPLVAGLSRAGS